MDADARMDMEAVMGEFRFALGDKLRDRISGFTGVVVSRSEHLFGCARYWLEPQGLHEGKPIEGRWLDDDSLELVEAGVIKAKRVRVVEEAQPSASTMRRAGGPSNQPSSHSRQSTR